MISPSRSGGAFVLVAVISAGAVSAEALSDGAPVLPPAVSGDTSRILQRWNFEDDAQGWVPEQDAEYRPWSSCARISNGFRGSRGALRVTGVNHWGSVGALVPCVYPGTSTKVTWSYRASACTDITAQGRVPSEKKQLHGTAGDFRADAWTVETLDVERWNHWDGGNLIGKGHDFSTLMLFCGVGNAGAREPELLIDDVVVWQGIDRTPPDRIRSAEASIDAASGEVVLTWITPPDNVAVARVVVHRGLTADFAIGNGSRIGEAVEAGFRDGAIANFGTYHYRFVAVDASGNESEASAVLKVPVVEQP